MSKTNPYLSSAIPQAEKQTSGTRSPGQDPRLSALEEQFAAFTEQMVKKNRDDLDAEYNIGMDNLDETLAALIRSIRADIADLTARVETLEGSQTP